MREEEPLGRLVYEQDEYAIYEVDGEENKVWPEVQDSRVALVLTCDPPALRPKPLPLRQTLPRHQIRLFRRLLLPLLSASPTTNTLVLISRKQWQQHIFTPRPSGRLLQQRENELGQQQPGLHPRLPSMAT